MATKTTPAQAGSTRRSFLRGAAAFFAAVATAPKLLTGPVGGPRHGAPTRITGLVDEPLFFKPETSERTTWLVALRGIQGGFLDIELLDDRGQPIQHTRRRCVGGVAGAAIRSIQLDTMGRAPRLRIIGSCVHWTATKRVEQWVGVNGFLHGWTTNSRDPNRGQWVDEEAPVVLHWHNVYATKAVCAGDGSLRRLVRKLQAAVV